MSEENVQAFCAKADTDEALGKKLAQVEPGDGALDQVVKIAAEAGFDVTANEIISVGRAVQGPEGEALSDEELSAVAGGANVSYLKSIKRLDISSLKARGQVGAMANNEPTETCVVRHRARWN